MMSEMAADSWRLRRIEVPARQLLEHALDRQRSFQQLLDEVARLAGEDRRTEDNSGGATRVRIGISDYITWVSAAATTNG